MNKVLATVVAVGALVTMSSAIPVTDIVQWNTGFFVDELSNTYNDPYYRWWNQDWQWQHNAIAPGSFSSATLSISAFDVDYSSGEYDAIYVKDEGDWVSLGDLAGASDEYSYTTFTLDSRFYNEIEAGLQVRIDIDRINTSDNWAVTLAKSVISLDNGAIPDPDPDPNPVPEPASAGFIIMGFASLIALKNRRK